VITGPIIAETAALLGEPARATMLSALLDGRALTASELAVAARITPQTASTHLAKLTEAGLLSAVRSGRRRYFRLASATVVEMIEGIVAAPAFSPSSGSSFPPGIRPAATSADSASIGPSDAHTSRVHWGPRSPSAASISAGWR